MAGRRTPQGIKEIGAALAQANPKASQPQILYEALKATLFDKQLAIATDPEQKRIAQCGRRSGKTSAATRLLLMTALAKPKSQCVYLADTLKRARRLVWDGADGLHSIVQDFGLEGYCSFNESEHRIDLGNGSKIWIGGCETLGDARAWKGNRWDAAILDECQDWKDEILRVTVEESIGPSLMDRWGFVLLGGTPGLLLEGFWWEACQGLIVDKETSKPVWSKHAWDCRANPYIVNAEAFIQSEMQALGLTEDSARIQREYRNRWVLDDRATLIEYRPGRNDYLALPVDKSSEWRYVIGADSGIRDLSALVVFAYRRFDPCVYILECFTFDGGAIDTMAAHLKGYQRKYAGVEIVLDAGSHGGLLMKEELLSRHGIYVEAAQRQGKAQFIQLMNTDLRLGLIKVFVPECGMLIKSWQSVGFDQKTGIEPKSAKLVDPLDAALYGWRACNAYLETARPPAGPDAEMKERIRRALEGHLPQENSEIERERMAMLAERDHGPWESKHESW